MNPSPASFGATDRLVLLIVAYAANGKAVSAVKRSVSPLVQIGKAVKRRPYRGASPIALTANR